MHKYRFFLCFPLCLCFFLFFFFFSLASCAINLACSRCLITSSSSELEGRGKGISLHEEMVVHNILGVNYYHLLKFWWFRTQGPNLRHSLLWHSFSLLPPTVQRHKHHHINTHHLRVLWHQYQQNIHTSVLTVRNIPSLFLVSRAPYDQLVWIGEEIEEYTGDKASVTYFNIIYPFLS